jgi:hypothetical protein
MPYSDAATGGATEYILPPRTHNTGSATYATPFDGPYDDNGQYEEVAQGRGAGTGRSRVYTAITTSNSVTYAIPFEGPYDNGQYEEVAQGGGTGTGRSQVYTDADVARLSNDVQYDTAPSSSNRGSNMVYAVSPNDVRCSFVCSFGCSTW